MPLPPMRGKQEEEDQEGEMKEGVGASGSLRFPGNIHNSEAAYSLSSISPTNLLLPGRYYLN